jgi:hypothetical protein
MDSRGDRREKVVWHRKLMNLGTLIGIGGRVPSGQIQPAVARWQTETCDTDEYRVKLSMFINLQSGHRQAEARSTVLVYP